MEERVEIGGKRRDGGILGKGAYEEPGKGMTCSPSVPTQAIAIWAGVTPFLEAIFLRESTSLRLCSKN